MTLDGEQDRAVDITAALLTRRLLVVDGRKRARCGLIAQLMPRFVQTVDSAATGAESLLRASQRYYDAALISLQLPDMTAHSLIGLLRQQAFKAPVVVLGHAASDSKVIQFLDGGANDYVAEPYHLGVLLARMRAHIRQFERTDDAAFLIGPYVFYPAQKRLVYTRGARALVLTAKEVDVLKYLYQYRDRVVDRMSLMRDVFGYRSDTESHTVEVHIYRLRQKMEFGGAQARIIHFGAGGYRLCADQSQERLAQLQPAAPNPSGNQCVAA